MSDVDAGLDATVRGFVGGQKVFDRYTLTKTLGRGGMGIVWLAHDEVLDRNVALKFLPEIIIHDRAVLEDLKRETKRSLELTHKNIVRIHDFVHDVISGCISMEYIEGDTLSNLRADKPTKIFEPDEIKPWLNQLCEALDYAHNHARIVHRDLKPSNLMISKRGHLKVADFGIARSLSDSVSMLTHARGTSGTLAYMSPQQLDGERGTHVDDIYSIGATIYELLTSKPPFYSGNIDRQIREKIAPSMTQRRKELEIEGSPIPRNWEEIVAACLAKDPARRPQSVTEVSSRLELSAPRTESLTNGKGSPSSPKTLFRTVTAALLLAVAVLAGWLGKTYIFRQPVSLNENGPRGIIAPAITPAPSITPEALAPAHQQESVEPGETKSPDDLAADVERQREYLHKLYSQNAQNTATGLKATPTPTFTGGIGPINPVVSHQYDGTWKGKDSKSQWTAVLIIKDGKSATITQELVERLPRKSDHWNDIAPPYNRARTFTRRWSTESRSVEATASGLNVYWTEWKLDLEPTMPVTALAKGIRQSPNPGWGFINTGGDLITGSWTFRRKH